MSDPLAFNVTATESGLAPELIASYIRDIFIYVNEKVLCSAFCLFSICANIVNGATFVKQGLNSSINVSFLALSISDIVRALLLFWMCVSSFNVLDNLDTMISFYDINYLTSACPAVCTNRVSLNITTYIAFERYLSIAAPLRVKKLLTPSRTIGVILVIILINALGVIPEYLSVYFDWRFFPSKNKSLLSISFGQNRNEMQKANYGIQAMLLVVSLFLVIVFTFMLVAQLKTQSDWRRKNASTADGVDPMSHKEKKTIKMVITIAMVMIVCYTPFATLSVLTASIPDLSIGGRQMNVFHVLGTFCFLFCIISAALNIFIYFIMSSRYRTLVKQYFKLPKIS